MKKQIFKNLSLLFLILVLGSSCSFLKRLTGDETHEAKKLLISARGRMEAIVQADRQSGQKMSKLMQIISSGDKAQAQAIVTEQRASVKNTLESLQQAIDDLKKASQLKVSEHYKEFLELKAQEYQKRSDGYAEGNKSLDELEKVIVDQNPEAIRTSQEKSRELRAVLTKIFKEAGELEGKAEDLVQKYKLDVQ